MSTPAQPSFTPGPWSIKWDFNVFGGERLVASAGGHSSNRDSERVTAENKANARLIAASPSLYAYAKAETLFFAWMRAAGVGEDEHDAAQNAYVEYITSLGWDGKPDPGGYLNTLRATALALAEGGGK